MSSSPECVIAKRCARAAEREVARTVTGSLASRSAGVAWHGTSTESLSGTCAASRSGVYHSRSGVPLGSEAGGQAYVVRTLSAGPIEATHAATRPANASHSATRMRRGTRGRLRLDSVGPEWASVGFTPLVRGGRHPPATTPGVFVPMRDLHLVEPVHAEPFTQLRALDVGGGRR